MSAFSKKRAQEILQSQGLQAAVDAYVAHRRQADDQDRQVIALLAAVCKGAGADEEERRAAFKKLAASLEPREIGSFMLRVGYRVDFENVASFKGSLVQRSRKKQLGCVLPEWQVNDKLKGRRFVEGLGLPVPKVHGIFPMAELPAGDDIVIKPRDGCGSRGVYILAGGELFDVRRKEALASRRELAQRMRRDLEAGKVKRDLWIVEEFIAGEGEVLNPPADLKFYCFYGEVRLVLEVTRRPVSQYCWWSGDGRRVETGKYDDKLFDGQGFGQSELDMAKRLSLEIPAPFLRIDFLKGRDRVVFGEFTPRPGDYEKFDDRTDRELGEAFLLAEERVQQDLLKGKTFAAYRQLIGAR